MRRHRLGFVVNIRYFDVGDDAVETSARVMCEARVCGCLGSLPPALLLLFLFTVDSKEKNKKINLQPDEMVVVNNSRV